MLKLGSLFVDLGIGLLVALLTMLLFDIDKLKYRLSRMFGFRFYNTFERINSRKQIIRNFNRIFVSYKHVKGGQILLMSNTGGYPEFDPYGRIIELANYDSLNIYLGVSKFAMKQYASEKPEIMEKMLFSKNIHLYVFDNLIPYQYRIGVNSDLEFGFYAMYYGHNDNKVKLEGIQSNNDIVLGGVSSMFFGLLEQGELVDQENIEATLGYRLKGTTKD